MMRFFGITEEDSGRIREYVAEVTDPVRDPEEPLPPPPAEDFGWLTFWTQVHLLQVSRPVVFWGVALALLIVLPSQLLLLLALHAF